MSQGPDFGDILDSPRITSLMLLCDLVSLLPERFHLQVEVGDELLGGRHALPVSSTFDVIHKWTVLVFCYTYSVRESLRIHACMRTCMCVRVRVHVCVSVNEHSSLLWKAAGSAPPPQEMTTHAEIQVEQQGSWTKTLTIRVWCSSGGFCFSDQCEKPTGLLSS